jgi:type IV pilus assembly protein PilV
MKPVTRLGAGPAARERGATLIEGMLAILIFSIGILGIMGLHAASIRNTTDAQFRAEASHMANSVIARMRVYDAGLVTTDFASPGGAQYTQWLDDVTAANATLPGMAANPPTIAFGGANGREITVSIFWQAGGDTAVRQQIVYSQLDQ